MLVPAVIHTKGLNVHVPITGAPKTIGGVCMVNAFNPAIVQLVIVDQVSHSCRH